MHFRQCRAEKHMGEQWTEQLTFSRSRSARAPPPRRDRAPTRKTVEQSDHKTGHGGCVRRGGRTTPHLLGGKRGVEEVAVDGERALLNGGLEVAASLRGVLHVEGGERAQRCQQIRAVRPRLQHLLQLPGHPRSQRRRHPARRRHRLAIAIPRLPPPKKKGRSGSERSDEKVGGSRTRGRQAFCRVAV